MSDRNPGWTLVNIVGSAQGGNVIVVATQTDWAGTLFTGDLTLQNVLPGDMVRFVSSKNWACDTTAGAGSDFALSINENNFVKKGTAAYRTLYEYPNQTIRHTAAGNIFAFNDRCEATWLIQSTGSFQLENPAEVSFTGQLDSLIMRKASQYLELWRPVLPNTSGFNPAFTTMSTNVVE